MDHSVHDPIDDGSARDELATSHHGEPAALEAAIGPVVASLRSVSAPPDISGRVMAHIAATRTESSPARRVMTAARRPLAWLWTPRPLTIRLRPAYAVAILGALSLPMVLAPSAGPTAGPEAPPAAAAAPPASRVYVQFRLAAEGASHVALAGSFTAWKPEYELRETSPGVWSILLPLSPGIHDYAFVVDGTRWIADPHAFQVDDGFGGTNSRIALPSSLAGSRSS